MYAREIFAVTDPAELQALLAELRFGCLVTHAPESGLSATHIPFVYDEGQGTFCGHIARENPHWRAGDGAGLIVFSQRDAYVSPSWYPSKAEHGRVVPTWNYEAVHVHGRTAWKDDERWLLAHLAALTDRFEANRPQPWKVSDAPDDFVRRLAAQVVGVEVTVERAEGVRKLSQNRPEPDRSGVIAGLSASAAPGDRSLAERMRATFGEGD